jgi:ribonuclease G
MKSLVKEWRKAQKAALQGSGPKLVFKERSIITSVIRDLFTEDVSEVYVDKMDDYREIMSYLKTVSPKLSNRVRHYTKETPLFDKFQIEKEMERSLKRKVWLKNGGYLFFDHAEALLAIDINTGRNVGKKDLEETIFQTNLVAAREICRQLRLRDIGGLIVVDFIDMRSNEHRKQIEREMRGCLAKDTSTTSCTSLSKFGLMEITRKRVRPGLQELFTDICHSCNGLGRVFSPATVTTRIDRWLRRAESTDVSKKLTIAVSPSVAEYIKSEKNRLLKELGKSHGFYLVIVVDETLDQDEFEIYQKGKPEPITEKYV